jgi:hypothetical protein
LVIPATVGDADKPHGTSGHPLNAPLATGARKAALIFILITVLLDVLGSA